MSSNPQDREIICLPNVLRRAGRTTDNKTGKVTQMPTVYASLKDIAQMCGVTLRSAEYWRKKGLLPTPHHREVGQNYWTPEQARAIVRWHLSKVNKRQSSKPLPR